MTSDVISIMGYTLIAIVLLGFGLCVLLAVRDCIRGDWVKEEKERGDEQ